MRQSIVATAIGMVAVLVITGSALAAKPDSSLSLVVLSSGQASVLSSTEPSYGGEITFEVATTQADRPFVNVRCYQGGLWVYDGWHGFFESYEPNPAYTLSSLVWTEGAADCAADLLAWGKNGKWKTLATTAFHVTD